MTYIKQLIVGCSVSIIPLQSFALDWVAGIEGGLTTIQVESEKFKIPVVQLHFGGRLENGVGAEIIVSSGVSDDEKVNVTNELTSQGSFFLTYTGEVSGPTLFSVGLGYAYTELDSQLVDTGFPGKLTFQSPAFAFRMEEKLQSFPNLKISGGFHHIFEDDDVTMRNFSLGVQYDF